MADQAGSESQGTARFRQILGLLAGPGLIYAYLIWVSIQPQSASSSSAYTNPWYWLYATAYYAIGGAGWLALVYWFVCRRRLSGLNRKAGGLKSDLILALALFIVQLIVGRVFYWITVALVPVSTSRVIETIETQLTYNPWALLAALGPYSFLAAGMMEEFNRVFLLERALALWPGKYSTVFFVALSAGLFGACHIYQGSSGVLNNAFFGLVFALFYIRYGRVLPMILAHGLYSAWLVGEGAVWMLIYNQSQLEQLPAIPGAFSF